MAMANKTRTYMVDIVVRLGTFWH